MIIQLEVISLTMTLRITDVKNSKRSKSILSKHNIDGKKVLKVHIYFKLYKIYIHSIYQNQ